MTIIMVVLVLVVLVVVVLLVSGKTTTTTPVASNPATNTAIASAASGLGAIISSLFGKSTTATTSKPDSDGSNDTSTGDATYVALSSFGF